MSIRTIIEINHDHLADLTNRKAFAIMAFIQSLGSAEPLAPPPGIRVLRQRHHSEKVTLEVE